ncbi:MAG: DUF3501 family protein [Gammaproteobacteria bacterium]|nr:DUF3501 family protein [Gammaproteobacteria bacterium]
MQTEFQRLSDLGAYNPLIPDSSNLKATMLIEYPDIEQRPVKLKKNCLASRTGSLCRWTGMSPCSPLPMTIWNAALKIKTSAVHFLRFELNTNMIVALKSGVAMFVGVDHPHYPCPRVSLLGDLLESLRNDFA